MEALLFFNHRQVGRVKESSKIENQNTNLKQRFIEKIY